MSDPDVRLLRAFVAVAETLNFSRAAERLGIAQQGLSAQVRQLESRVDATLFRRTTRQVALTAAGEALLPHARAAIAAVEEGVEAIRRATAAAANAIVVAGLDDAGAVGAAVLERARRDLPDVTLSVRDAFPSQRLLDEAPGPPAAVAFVRPPFRGLNRLSTVTLRVERRLAALAADHPLAGRERVAPSDLMDEAWVSIGASDRVADSHWLLEDHRYGGPPRIAGRPEGWDDLLALVAERGAVALVPEGVADARPRPGVVTVPVEGIAPSALALAWRPADETAAVRELAEIARQVAQR